MVYSRLIVACWVVFFIYWVISALGSKRMAKSYGRHMFGRVAIMALVLVFVRSRPADINIGIAVPPAVRIFGVLVCATGITFAIWARRHIGKNWGMPMTVHEAPELITTGPYARLRHPIYTGVLVALVGTALALSLWWFVAVVVGLIYFGYAARKEEGTLLTTFPREYAEYQGRTKMIIPGVF